MNLDENLAVTLGGGFFWRNPHWLCLKEDHQNSSYHYRIFSSCPGISTVPTNCEYKLGWIANNLRGHHYKVCKALYAENANNCWNDGFEDGKADNPFNEERDNGCDEYNPDYEQGYNSGCISHDTDNTCELKIKGEKSYCPWHPDIAACTEFLHNATNKRPAQTGICAGTGDPRPYVICPQESNPEGYCLTTDDPAFCKTIGDICDAEGFVKPEYPYCTK